MFSFYKPCCLRFSSLGIYKKFSFALSTITFTVNSHTDNHYCIVQFEISFSIKIHVKRLSFDQSFLYSNLILVLPALIFSNKNHDLQKKKTLEKVFLLDFVKIIESHIVHSWLHVQSE